MELVGPDAMVSRKPCGTRSVRRAQSQARDREGTRGPGAAAVSCDWGPGGEARGVAAPRPAPAVPKLAVTSGFVVCLPAGGRVLRMSPTLLSPAYADRPGPALRRGLTTHRPNNKRLVPGLPDATQLSNTLKTAWPPEPHSGRTGHSLDFLLSMLLCTKPPQTGVVWESQQLLLSSPRGSGGLGRGARAGGLRGPSRVPSGPRSHTGPRSPRPVSLLQDFAESSEKP